MMGKVFRFGDNIDTDVLAPGQYMAAPLDVLASHCLETVAPEFAGSVLPGDIILAGRNFGMGSSREQAAQALKHLGIAGIVAHSFGGIFYRNAINLGLPVFVHEGPIAAEPGDAMLLDIDAARLTHGATGRVTPLEPLPGFLLDLIRDGGLVPHLEKRFAAKESRA